LVIKKQIKIADIKRVVVDEERDIDKLSIYYLVKIIFILWVIFCLMACLMKAQFLDALIVCDFYIIYHFNSATSSRIMAIVILIAISILMDLYWIILYSTVKLEII